MSQRAMPDFGGAGDETPGDAFKPSQLRAKLARAVTASCPLWLSDSAEDIVQSAMLRVINLTKKNEGKTDFNSSYLWRVAYSALVDEIRRRRRRREVEFTEDAVCGPHLNLGSPDPERQAGAKEMGAFVRDCLKQMLETRRSAVTAYLHGHSVPETARLLGWTSKKAENLVYRGLADLRRCLQSKGIHS